MMPTNVVVDWEPHISKCSQLFSLDRCCLLYTNNAIFFLYAVNNMLWRTAAAANCRFEGLYFEFLTILLSCRQIKYGLIMIGFLFRSFLLGLFGPHTYSTAAYHLINLKKYSARKNMGTSHIVTKQPISCWQLLIRKYVSVCSRAHASAVSLSFMRNYMS